MSHLRTQIRNAVVATLGLTGSRVYASRRHPVEADKLPALCVYAFDETSELHGKAAAATRPLLRQLNMAVEAVAQANDNVDDSLDVICGDVEVALGADPTLGGLAYDCHLTGTKIAIVATGDRTTAHALMTFTVFYRTRAADPSFNSI